MKFGKEPRATSNCTGRTSFIFTGDERVKKTSKEKNCIRFVFAKRNGKDGKKIERNPDNKLRNIHVSFL